jgi:DNA-binding response OmpR family regulator
MAPVGVSTRERLLLLNRTRDVTVVIWPGDAAEMRRRTRDERPCLFLVESGAEPPRLLACLHDWTWASADDAEIEARVVALADRAARHPSRPTIDTFGELIHRGRSLFLSPLDQRVAETLVGRFGAVVKEHDLLTAVWPEGGSRQALRVHMSRLRRRLAPLGLVITCVRGSGYIMRDGVVAVDDVHD